MRTITFNELRKIKDSLPSGSMHRIADELRFARRIQCATSSEAIISRKEKVSEYILSPVRMAGL